MRVGYLARGPIMSAFVALLLAAAIAPACAQSDYPNRPIRVVVGFAAGGGNDIFARIVGARLSEIVGQPVVIENKPGAEGRLAAEYAAHQPANGYTLLVAPSATMSVAAAIYPDLPYQPTKTFLPLSMIGSFPFILVVAADHPAKTVRELAEWAKQHPDKANYASSAPSFTITMELLKLNSGMPGIMIPYKSTNEEVLSVIQGQTMTTFSDGPPTIPQVNAGKVRALAVTGPRRSPELPDVPSMAEAGYPGVDFLGWSGIFAPTATPPAIVAKLEKALSEAIRDPGVSAKLKALTVDPGGGPPEDFRRMIDAQIIKYTGVVKTANLHFE